MVKSNTDNAEAARCKKLRDGTIEWMKKAVNENPDEYDAERLEEAIEKVKSVPDENIDAYLIMNHHLNILCKQVEFSESERKKLDDMLKENFKVNKMNRCEQDDRTRDDIQFSVKTDKCDNVIVWVNKSRPLFKDRGYYNILMCGGMFSFCMDEFQDMDSLLNRLKKKIESYEP